MIIAAAIVGYLSIALAAFRWAIRRYLREWSNLPLDVGFCAYIALAWPVAVPTMAALTHQPKKRREWTRLRKCAER